LEKYAGDHSKAADAVFLLGYQYQMLGYRQQARDQYAEALKLVPADKLAAKVLGDAGGNTAARVPSSPATKLR
jgi:Flp pilus assembly protein TadD